MNLDRNRLIEWARAGLRMPIAVDLVLHEEDDVAAVRLDPVRLARVLERTARRFRTPLALPLMDLSLEKSFIGACLGVPESRYETFHLEAALPPEKLAQTKATLAANPLLPAMQSAADALGCVERAAPDLVPCGMVIGPFSLATKLLADPIVPVALAASGMTADDDEEVALFECALALADAAIERNLKAQLAGGARAIFVAEPAANLVYISPRQMEAGSDIFERYVMAHNRKIRDAAAAAGAPLLFHCCGELTDAMVRAFADMRPEVLSLGSPRKLWEIEPLVPKDVVLFGNLPSKKFFSKTDMPVARVEALARELLEKMGATGHPFVLASECDILRVPGCEREILDKIDAFMNAR